MKRLLLILLITCIPVVMSAEIKDISSQRWELWLDRTATFWTDSLFVHPDLGRIPINSPSCGWDHLYGREDAYEVTLPATIEQYVWGENGNDHGICGNYVGVSWFSTEIFVPSEWSGRRVTLAFESVRLRAEVFLNDQLVGYDIINGTPFVVDISNRARYGEENRLSIRITDPNGNFAWRDWDSFAWGKYEIPPSHGFGGITGHVYVNVQDKTYIDNVFVRNNPDPDRVTVQTELCSADGTPFKGTVHYSVLEKDSGKVVWTGKDVVVGGRDLTRVSRDIRVKGAKLWSPDSPSLYQLKVEWKGSDGDNDQKEVGFGFRWFDVRMVGGDRMFFNNGKRVVLHTAISWGHWPENGIFPTPELARKHILAAKELGMNMLSFHRGIGQECILDLADELGLFIYEEPGGYKPGRSAFALEWKREKLARMIVRDRNHPSLVIVNMINEAARDPFPSEVEDMKMAHRLDPTRCITFTSSYFGPMFYDGICPSGEAPVKMTMFPLDTVVHYSGWWDTHHADGPGVYQDAFYNGPMDFLRYKKESDEIIFYGEEGAIGTPAQLSLIKPVDDRSGWNGGDAVRQYDAFDAFLRQKGFQDAFPDVDSLCRSLGSVAYYYQGRMMENIYISNNIDGWATNGWEDTKVENHSGIVDIRRNHKADPAIIAYYNQPLYVAVKARKKVLNQGDVSVTDFFVVNRVDLRGPCELRVWLQDEEGAILGEPRVFHSVLEGGVRFGQLLAEGIPFVAGKSGYCTIRAELYRKGKRVAYGSDVLFSVGSREKPDCVFVADTSSMMQGMLSRSGVRFQDVKISEVPDISGTLVLGPDLQPGIVKGAFRQDDPLIDWVSRGGHLVILSNAASWTSYLEQKEVADYRGARQLGRNWFGGNFFVGHHPLFDGLPQATAFNWEYQCFASYDRHREGLRLENGTCVVGCYSDHKNELFSALSILPVGRGLVIVSSLDFVSAAGNPVCDRLLVNILSYN